MPDYKSMYYQLFKAQTKAMRILESAHLDTEKQFMVSKEPVKLAEGQKNLEDGDDAHNG